ncbi:unnamed protein product [Discosporangium mesarthrocarpum]
MRTRSLTRRVTAIAVSVVLLSVTFLKGFRGVAGYVLPGAVTTTHTHRHRWPCDFQLPCSPFGALITGRSHQILCALEEDGPPEMHDDVSDFHLDRGRTRPSRSLAPLAAGGSVSAGMEGNIIPPSFQRRKSSRLGYVHITDETLDRIRAEVSIMEVVGRQVDLKPTGRGGIGCCPFHDDRTPSFSVDESRGYYQCFGCHAKGDVITFVMQMEGATFMEAVKTLADECGVDLHPASSRPVSPREMEMASQRREERERLGLVLEMAAQFYTRCLVEMPSAGVAR